MKSYVWVTFVFMGWGYYELSDGADFVPEQREVAVAEPIEEPEIVARAQTSTLMSLSTSNVSPQVSDAEMIQVVAQAAALDAVEAEVVEVTAPAVQAKLDIREVAGSRVNMRMGPGTGFDVVMTLDGGAQIEVLSVNAEGWANVSTVDRGLEGWMAERLLSDPQT